MSYLDSINVSYNNEILTEIVKYQQLCMPTYDEGDLSLYLQYDLPRFFDKIQHYKGVTDMKKKPCLIKVLKQKYNNKEEFCNRYLIRGRKSNHLLNKIIKIF